MSKRFECEHNWIIDNNKRKTNESLIVYDEEWNTLDDLCELLNQQDQRIAELEAQLKNAIVPKFRIGDCFIEYWDKTPSIYQYQGNKHFKCLNKSQGYHCDYVILGALLLEEDFIKQISKEEAQSKLEEKEEEIYD